MKKPKKPKREILPVPVEMEYFTYVIFESGGIFNLVKNDTEDMSDSDYVSSLNLEQVTFLFNAMKDLHPNSDITLECGCNYDGYNNYFYFDVKRNLTEKELEAEKSIRDSRQKAIEEQFDKEMKEYLDACHRWNLWKLEEAKAKYGSKP